MHPTVCQAFGAPEARPSAAEVDLDVLLEHAVAPAPGAELLVVPGRQGGRRARRRRLGARPPTSRPRCARAPESCSSRSGSSTSTPATRSARARSRWPTRCGSAPPTGPSRRARPPRRATPPSRSPPSAPARSSADRRQWSAGDRRAPVAPGAATVAQAGRDQLIGDATTARNRARIARSPTTESSRRRRGATATGRARRPVRRRPRRARRRPPARSTTWKSSSSTRSSRCRGRCRRRGRTAPRTRPRCRWQSTRTSEAPGSHEPHGGHPPYITASTSCTPSAASRGSTAEDSAGRELGVDPVHQRLVRLAAQDEADRVVVGPVPRLLGRVRGLQRVGQLVGPLVVGAPAGRRTLAGGAGRSPRAASGGRSSTSAHHRWTVARCQSRSAAPQSGHDGTRAAGSQSASTVAEPGGLGAEVVEVGLGRECGSRQPP